MSGEALSVAWGGFHEAGVTKQTSSGDSKIHASTRYEFLDETFQGFFRRCLVPPRTLLRSKNPVQAVFCLLKKLQNPIALLLRKTPVSEKLGFSGNDIRDPSFASTHLGSRFPECKNCLPYREREDLNLSTNCRW